VARGIVIISSSNTNSTNTNSIIVDTKQQLQFKKYIEVEEQEGNRCIEKDIHRHNIVTRQQQKFNRFTGAEG
jgi:hypothetical protein